MYIEYITVIGVDCRYNIGKHIISYNIYHTECSRLLNDQILEIKYNIYNISSGKLKFLKF